MQFRLASLLLCAFVTGTGCSSVAQFSPDRTSLERMMEGIVRISARKDWNSTEETFAGTAFVISKEPCILATAAHVSWDRSHVAVYRFNARTGRIVSPQRPIRAYSDQGSDLSFVHVDPAVCQGADPYVFPLLNDPLSEIGIGNEVFILGHTRVSISTQTDVPVMRAGIVASTEAKRYKEPVFTLDLLAFPGLSGSPVVLKRTGQVVGVLFETTDAIARFSGFSRAALIKQRDLSESIEMFPPLIKKEQ